MVVEQSMAGAGLCTVRFLSSCCHLAPPHSSSFPNFRLGTQLSQQLCGAQKTLRHRCCYYTGGLKAEINPALSCALRGNTLRIMQFSSQQNREAAELDEQLFAFKDESSSNSC